MIEYYTSELSPGRFFAAIDGVIVAMWHIDHWQDRCIYRPVRQYYHKIEWMDKPFNPLNIIARDEFIIVKITGKEANIEYTKSGCSYGK